MLRFTPAAAGSSLAVVSGVRALLVRTPDDAATIDALWGAVSTGADIQAVVEVLASGGLFQTPPFALFQATAGVTGAGYTITCIVRGDMPLQLTTLDGVETVDASGVTTWVERSVPHVVAFSAGTDAGAGGLPIVGGVVWAGSIRWSADGKVAPASAPVATPASAVVTAPAAAPVAPAAPAEAAKAEPAARESVATETVAEHTIASSTATLDELLSDAGLADAGDGYDSLFEATMVRSIEDAAVRPPSEDDEHAASDSAAHVEERKGDHDGMTVMSGDIAKLRAGRKGRGAPPAAEPEPSVAYTLTLSTGGVETLDGLTVVGRAPSVSKVSGGQLPKLIAIPGDQDISRNHVQFAVEGGTVVVTDLHSRNGTTIALPGKAPQLLRQGESTSVLVNTVVDLGGGVTITVGHA